MKDIAPPRIKFRPVRASLREVTGKEYIEAVCAAHSLLTQTDRKKLLALGAEKVDFFPQEFQIALKQWLPQTGSVVGKPFLRSCCGATTQAFNANSHLSSAPVQGYGYYRVGEDGRLRLLAKSEHYHAPLGHAFPGYHLVDLAKRFGIPNATHNNTRGHITRLAEQELVRVGAGLARGDEQSLGRVIRSKNPAVLNRVLNLETGSLAVEAALKMILARFYAPQSDAPAPKYAGRVPVLVVIGDDDGQRSGNYHGTTILTQTTRGMWPGMLEKMESAEVFLVRTVRPNRLEDLESVFSTYDSGRYKIAGFFHELVMMNYGARRLSEKFIRRAYALCRRHDVPTVADEIQSCLWSPELFSFREYKIQPTFVAVGKGFPGGEYPASRILFNSSMDTLPQFGALVTNGQEELASLAYLITMRWAEENAEVTRRIGEYYAERLDVFAAEFPWLIKGIEGCRQLSAVCFNDLAEAKKFIGILDREGVDISVQAYKTDCPPAALTKLPLIAGPEAVDMLIERMRYAAAKMAERGN